MTAARRLPVIADDRPGVHRVRAMTVSVNRLAKRELAAGAKLYPERPGVDYQRPRTFAECQRAGLGDDVPCPFVSCKHHLYLDVNPRNGAIKINFPDRDPVDLTETCAKRVAMRGGATLEEVSQVIGVVRERVRQLECDALAKLRGETVAIAEDLDD